jgi:copper(I)-binding protein
MKQLLVALILAAGVIGTASAQTPASSGIAVTDVWARGTPGGAETEAVYLTLVNHGADGGRLVGVAVTFRSAAGSPSPAGFVGFLVARFGGEPE